MALASCVELTRTIKEQFLEYRTRISVPAEKKLTTTKIVLKLTTGSSSSQRWIIRHRSKWEKLEVDLNSDKVA